MKINKLILNNFKSYYGSNSFDLSVTDEKNVIVICADGGFGKTSLMQAINWALYSDLYIDEFNDGRKAKDKVSLKNWINETHLIETIKSATIGELSVEMQYYHENESYNILNKITFSAKSKDEIEIQTQDQILKKLPIGGKWTTSNNIKVDINRVLPFTIKNYFFFDAEKQSSLTKPDNEDKVRDAIYNVIGLQAIKDAIDDLHSISKSYGNELKNLDLGAYSGFQKKKTDLEEKIDDEKIKIENFNKENRSLKNFIDSIETELRGLKDSSEIQKKIDELRKEKTQLVVTKTDREKLLSKLCYKSIPFLLLNKLKIFNDDLLKLKDQGKIPGSISINLLNEIITVGKCICNTDLNDPNSEHSINCKKRINALKEEIGEQNENKQKLLDIFNGTSFFISSLNEQDKNALSKGISEIDIINDTINNIDEEIKDLERELGDISDEDIQKKKKKKDELTESLEINMQSLGSLSSQIEIDKKELKQIIEDLSKINIQNEKAKALKNYQETADKSSDVLDDIYNHFTVEARKAISKETSEHWHILIKSTKTLNVEVDTSFSFNVTNSIGQRADHGLSEGQRQGLVLAFVDAISVISQKFPPYIIDMPLGRLGPDGQKEVAQFLPKTCDQLILLLNKSSEWNDLTRQYLIPKCNNIYELLFDNDRRQTSINLIQK